MKSTNFPVNTGENRDARRSADKAEDYQEGYKTDYWQHCSWQTSLVTCLEDAAALKKLSEQVF
jgi:hypothetical protein